MASNCQTDKRLRNCMLAHWYFSSNVGFILALNKAIIFGVKIFDFFQNLYAKHLIITALLRQLL